MERPLPLIPSEPQLRHLTEQRLRVERLFERLTYGHVCRPRASAPPPRPLFTAGVGVVPALEGGPLGFSVFRRAGSGRGFGAGLVLVRGLLRGTEPSRVASLAPLDESGEHHEEKEKEDRVDREAGDPGAAIEPEVEPIRERDAEGVDRREPDG